MVALAGLEGALPPAPSPAPPRYRAFISYSHRDLATAKWLHAALERYRLPARLVGTESPFGPVPARLSPIFRDLDELPAAEHLSAAVTTALGQSAALIVLASPDAAASRWVAKEIESFRALHGHGRPILVALARGEPADAFPAALAAAEPIAADLRPGQGGRRLALLKLVAGLSGVGLDALVQRDAQRQRARVTAITVGAVALVLILSTALILALKARAEAETARAQAEGLVEYMLTDLREKLKGVGRLDVMGGVNSRALTYYGAQDLTRLAPDALERRARILHAMGEDELARGNTAAALRHFTEANRVTKTLLADAPRNPDRLFAQAQSEFWLGQTYRQQGNANAALARMQAYSATAEALAKAEPDAVRGLVERHYASAAIGTILLRDIARPNEALPSFEAALRFIEQAARIGGNDYLMDRAEALAWLADTNFDLRRFDAALLDRQKQARLLDQMIATDRVNVTYRFAAVVNRRAQARILVEQGKLSQAAVLAADADALMSGLVAVEPKNMLWLSQQLSVAIARADIAARRGAGDEALRYLDKADRLMVVLVKANAGDPARLRLQSARIEAVRKTLADGERQ
ncbi:toll/interleukin-1 receptor domain-containing protein [Sandaracinobacteroides saxicola]|uniref:Toll/interleukin-1 receptor domain-containing protein n=1 Tax=Sandaracinobacteroides saxicola TaxID=2759707 RepID=A0A7G5IJ67_9SPHN|nr:toll/interleukin-1 receptor domain-containing protein [Sandaracinobacteroides saxicola]QMW23409.1 toll/interleukin-1 receptor domain-containing protein [Sandaracinobacteroides saxicola]